MTDALENICLLLGFPRPEKQWKGSELLIRYEGFKEGHPQRYLVRIVIFLDIIHLHNLPGFMASHVIQAIEMRNILKDLRLGALL